MITTTLNRIRAHSPCREGWEKLLEGLGKTSADDEPLLYSRILEINGLDDALWCCRAEPQYDRQWRLYAVWCARLVQHLMKDPRSIAALDAAERHARGDATDDDLAASGAAAWAAADAAWGAAAWGAAACAAADAACAAADAACAAADAAAGAAAWASADAAAGAAAWASAGASAGAAQATEFLRVVTETENRT